jgi:hypothetical protein
VIKRRNKNSYLPATWGNKQNNSNLLKKGAEESLFSWLLTAILDVLPKAEERQN